MKKSNGNPAVVTEEFMSLEPIKMINARTNIYHITYTPEQKEINLFFWGCNIDCRGCYCKRRIFSPMLKDFIDIHFEKPVGIASPPTRFLYLDEVIEILDGLDFNKAILEGQEASLDPLFPEITSILHTRYGSHNSLLTNAYNLPHLKHLDKIEVGIKAVTESLHREYTGISNSRILKHVNRIYDSGIQLIVDSVLIPDLIDRDETERIAKFIGDIDRNIPYAIIAYVNFCDIPWRRPTAEEMEEAAEAAKKHLNRVFFFRGNEEMIYEMTSVFPSELEIAGKSKDTVYTLTSQNTVKQLTGEKIMR